MVPMADWALKRFLKFVLKRKLGKYLHEPDLKALDVEIGTGRVEMRHLLLKCDQITSDLAVPGWEVRACYLGCLKAQLPFSAMGLLSGECSIDCDELLVTIAALAPQSHPHAHDTAQSSGQPSTQDAPARSNSSLGTMLDELGMLGQPNTSMEDVIQSIAGGLHTMLQKLSLSVTNVLIRVEVPLAAPSPAHLSSAPQQVAIVTLNVDSIKLTDQGQSGSDGGSGASAALQTTTSMMYRMSQQYTSWYGGSTGAGADKGTSGSTGYTTGKPDKQVQKLVEVSGLTLQLHVGPPVQTDVDSSIMLSPESSSKADGGLPDSPPPDSSSATPSYPPLLCAPGGGGLSLSVRLGVTSHPCSPSNSAAGAGAGGMFSPPNAPPQPAMTKVSVDVSMSPTFLCVLPEHHTCLSAVVAQLQHQLSRAAQPASAPAQAGAGLTRVDEAGGGYGWGGVVQPSDLLDDSTDPTSPAAHGWAASLNQVWGTTSLLGSFLLDDYQDLVAHSPYVAHSFSLADSHMSDANDWRGSSRMTPAPLHSPLPTSPPFSSRLGQHEPGSPTESSSQSFHDAQSVFGSCTSSAASSMHTAMQGSIASSFSLSPHTKTRSPDYPSAPASHSQALFTDTSPYPASYSAATPARAPAPAPQPEPSRRLPPAPPPPPAFLLTVKSEELQLFMGFDSNSNPSVSSCKPAVSGQRCGSDGLHHHPGLLLVTRDVLVHANLAGDHVAGHVELQELHVMELVAESAAVDMAACKQASHEFAAIPSKFHKSLNCYRPDPAWLVVPQWAACPSTSTTSSACSKSVAAWPLLYCGGGLRSAGVRPSVCVRVHQQVCPPGAHTTSSHAATMHSGGGVWGGHTAGLLSSNGYGGDHLGFAPLSDVSVSGGRQAAPDAVKVQVEVLPITLWLCQESLDRIEQGLKPLIGAVQSPGAVEPPCQPNPGGLTDKEAQKAAVKAAINSILSNQQRHPHGVHHSSHTLAGNGWASTSHQQQQQQHNTNNKQLPELELSVSVPHVCILARLPVTRPHVAPDQPAPPPAAVRSTKTAAGRAAGPLPAQDPRVYVLLDVLCPSHQDHVSHQRMLPHQGPPLIRLVCGRQPAELVIRSTATCELAAARLRLHIIHKPNSPAPTPHPTAPTSNVSSKYVKPHAAAPGLASAPSTALSSRWVTCCLVEVGPRSPSQPVASTGHEPATGLGVQSGSQDLPPGCGVFASVLWDPHAPSVSGTDVLHHVQQYFHAHSANRWTDGEGDAEGPGWGGRTSPGPGSIRSLELEERSSHVFAHLRISSAHVQLSGADLDTLMSIIPSSPPHDSPAAAANKPTTTAPTASSTNRQPTHQQHHHMGLAHDRYGLGNAYLDVSKPPAPEPIRVTMLVNAHVQVTLKPSTSMSDVQGVAGNDELGAGGKSAAGPRDGSPAPTPCFQLTMSEVSALHVGGLSETGMGRLLAVSAQGVQLMRLASSSPAATSAHPGNKHQSRSHTAASNHRSSGHTSGHHASRGSSPPSTPWWVAPEWQDMCLMYCPMRMGGAATQPCLDVVLFQPPPEADPTTLHSLGTPAVHGTPSSDNLPSPAPSLSVLIRGVTISTDQGSLTVSWIQQLIGLLKSPSTHEQPSTAAPSGNRGANTATAASTGQAEPPPADPLKLVVTLQDIALRHEPLPYPTEDVAAEYIATRCPDLSASSPGRDLSGSGLGSDDGMHSHSVPGSVRRPGSPRERPTPSAVAMVLLAEHVRYETGGEQGQQAAGQLHSRAGAQQGCSRPAVQQHLVIMNSVGLHLALADCRGQGWGPAECFDVSGAKLQAFGYHCVLSETALKVRIRIPPSVPDASSSSSAADSKQAAGAGRLPPDQPQCVDIDIRNQQVLGVLTQDSAALLLQLSTQLSAYLSAASAPPLSAQPGSVQGVQGGMQQPDKPKAADRSSSSSSPPRHSVPALEADTHFQSVTERTQELIKQVLAHQDFFSAGGQQAGWEGPERGGSGEAGQAGSQRGQSNTGSSGWYHTAPVAVQGQGSTQAGEHSTPDIIIIDDFLKVPAKGLGGSDDDSASPTSTLTSGWEHMPSSATFGTGPLGSVLGNSPPESAGVWYPQQQQPQTDPTTPTTTSTTVPSQAAGKSGNGLTITKPAVDKQLLGGSTAAAAAAHGAVQGSTSSAAEGGTAVGPPLMVCEDYVPLGSPTSSPGGSQLPSAGLQRPAPTLRITFNNFAGLSVLHTTRGSGGAQAGRVEAQVEGATLVIEIYPQSGHEARMLHLRVRELEVRDCRAQQAGHTSSHPPAPGFGYSPDSMPWATSHSSSSTSRSRAASGSSRASRVKSGLANGVGAAAQAAQVTFGGAAKLAVGLPAGRGTPKKWIKILSYRQHPDRPRDARSSQLEVVLDIVRPDPEHHPQLEELRLQVCLLPVRLRLDQDVLQYLLAFGTAVMNPHTTAALDLLGQLQVAAQTGGDASPLPFFQHVHISPCACTIDYRPRRIHVAALKAGSLVELLSMVPLGGLELEVAQVALTGVAGWDQLGAAAAREWISHIAHTQAHKFLLGLAPVHALVRVAGAVTSLLGAPPLARGFSMGMALAAGAAAAPLSGIRRLQSGRMAAQVREGVLALSRLLVAEALAAGNNLAADAQQYMGATGSAPSRLYADDGDDGDVDDDEPGLSDLAAPSRALDETSSVGWSTSSTSQAPGGAAAGLPGDAAHPTGVGAAGAGASSSSSGQRPQQQRGFSLKKQLGRVGKVAGKLGKHLAGAAPWVDREGQGGRPPRHPGAYQGQLNMHALPSAASIAGSISNRTSLDRSSTGSAFPGSRSDSPYWPGDGPSGGLCSSVGSGGVAVLTSPRRAAPPGLVGLASLAGEGSSGSGVRKAASSCGGGAGAGGSVGLMGSSGTSSCIYPAVPVYTPVPTSSSVMSGYAGSSASASSDVSGVVVGGLHAVLHGAGMHHRKAGHGESGGGEAGGAVHDVWEEVGLAVSPGAEAGQGEPWLALKDQVGSGGGAGGGQGEEGSGAVCRDDTLDAAKRKVD